MLDIPIELYNTDGSVGAALGAGVGANIFSKVTDAFSKMKPTEKNEPLQQSIYEDLYQIWKENLNKVIKMNQPVEE